MAAGSLAAGQAAGSIPGKAARLRQELLAAGTLTPTTDGFLQFTQPHRFATANEAAEVLVARAVNAQLAWKQASGKQVRDFK